MTRYVATTGSNSNDGTIGSPWLTPEYAIANSVAGDIIQIAAGTYSIASQITIPVGISLQGAGDTTILSSTVAGTFTLYLQSTTQNTNGAQFIRNLKMDGNSITAYGAIHVRRRGNVRVFNCTIVDFSHYGAMFYGGQPPTTYCTENKFYDNTVTNCSGYYGGNLGCLVMDGQDGMQAYGNTMNADRGGANCGDVIYCVEGFLKNVKIYNNTLVKTYVPGVTSWDFAIEIWNILGGVEIYGNTITGSIDLVNSVKGTAAYSAWVHDNTMGQAALLAGESIRGILLESSLTHPHVEDVIIERNFVQNVAVGVFLDQMDGTCNVNNVMVSCNIFNNIGMLGTNSKGWGMYWTNEGVWGNTVNDIFVLNNVFIGYVGPTTTSWGIQVPDTGTVTNVYIRNNIVENFDYAPVFGYATGKSGITVDTLFIENNIFYGNGNSNAPRYNDLVPTNNTTQNNIIDDPDFVSSSDFHIQAGSPAIGAGIDVDLYTDFEENAWDTPPSIGAYAYAGAPPPPPPEVPVTSITVTATNYFITTNQGTLQLTANVLPLNAFNSSVNWSVTPGTGTASVSPTGLLTALSNGYVTIRATAVDGSGVYGERMIDISGQSQNSLKDRDGNIYTTVVIGTQEWIIESLRTTHYADGTIIPNLTECTDPDLPQDVYGAMYNWYAVTNVKGIAASGWHVASRPEWEALESALGGSGVAGGKLKETGTTYWDSPNTGATNISGFNLKGGGFRTIISGAFEYIKLRGCTWLTTTVGLNNAYAGGGFNNTAGSILLSTDKRQGMNLRLLKDSTILSDGQTSTYTGNDGKVYNTICIGTQEWLSENLDETRYADNSLIPVITGNSAWIADSDGAVCYYNNNVAITSSLTAWTNIDFNTFTTSGANISNANESAGTYGHAKSNDISLVIGNTLYFNFNLTLIAGTLPRASIYKDGVFVSSVLITEGLNNLTFSITSNGDYAVGFISDVAGSQFSAACDMFSSSLNGWLTDSSGAYCWYDNDITNKNPYGALYSKNAVDNPRGLAYLERGGFQESGWRVAASSDFNTLITYLGTTGVGGKLKETGTTHWTTPNTGATDERGFAAVPSGIRLVLGGTCLFAFKGTQCYMWDTDNNLYYLSYDSTDIASAGYDSHTGAAVRLVRDYVAEDTPDPPVPPTFPDVIPYNYGAIPTYRFYISSASSVTYEVFPLKFLSSTLVNELETNQIFYRNKFNGSLLFGSNSKVINDLGVEQNRRDDWDLFWSVEQGDPSEKLYLTINKDFGGVIETYWEGYFSTSDGKFDIDSCTFEVTPLAIDDYTEILDAADVQYNIINVPAMGNVTANLGGIDYVYTRTRWLARLGMDNVLEYIAQQVAGITAVVQSNFFTAATDPITLADNKLLYLTIAQKSDIARYTSSDAATSAMLSWNELMDIFWTMFQVRWDYDLLTNTFRVEHISYFSNVPGIDLRTQLSCVATNKYQYLKEKMPKYEKFSFMEADGTNFVGTPIWYDSGMVNQDANSNTAEWVIPVTTDLEYIINGGNVADEGFVILCNTFTGGNYLVRKEFGRFDNSFFALNMDLSMANLQHNYFKYERSLIEGYMNGTLQTFFTARKVKQQECTAILCEALNPSGEITTELGETYFGGAKAIVKTASQSPTGEVKFTLLYGPLPNSNPGVPDDLFGVSAVPSLSSTNDPDDTIDIEFTFNMPCPGNFNVRVREFVYNNLGALVDTGGWESMTFLTGTTSYTFNPTFLSQILTGYSVKLEFEYTGSEIDLFRGKDDPLPSFMYFIPYVYTVL